MTDIGKYTILTIDKIKEYENNARTHDAQQVQQLVASIDRWGFTNPVLVDEDNNLIAGHGRLEAARALGMKQVPAIIVGTIRNDDDRRALILADNQIAMNAGWDMDKLRAELTHLKSVDVDMNLMGFIKSDLDSIFAKPKKGLTHDDAAPALPVVPVSRATDVWRLGDHLVMCGSAASMPDILRLMGSDKADMVWTDPPYNVNYEGTAGKIQNDNLSAKAFMDLLNDSHSAAYNVLKAGGAIYVAHADTEGLAFRLAFNTAGFKLSGCLIWRKPSLVLGRSDYQWQHEPILYGWKPGAAHQWHGGRKQTTMVDTAQELGFTQINKDTFLLAYNGRMIEVSGDILRVKEVETSVITIDKPTRSAEHPTMKPVELIERHLNNSSVPAEIVLDPFGGSGSTLIACEKHGRRARLMELDPKFVDVIIARWEAYTGQTATLDATGQTFKTVAKIRKDKK